MVTAMDSASVHAVKREGLTKKEKMLGAAVCSLLPARDGAEPL